MNNQALNNAAALKDGWYHGTGRAPAIQALDCARLVLSDLEGIGLPAGRLYPDPTGGLRAEWTVAAEEISIDFEESGAVYR